MKKIFSLVLATLATTTMAFATVQQVSDNVQCGTTKNLRATPKTGYHFVNWKANDVIVSTANPWNNVEVTADVTYTATFAPNEHTLAWSTDGDALTGYHYTVTPQGGTTSNEIDVTTSEASACTATITVQSLDDTKGTAGF